MGLQFKLDVWPGWDYIGTMDKGAEGRTRSLSVRFRVNESERDLLREAADFAGLDLSSWIRERLLRAARKELTAKKE